MHLAHSWFSKLLTISYTLFNSSITNLKYAHGTYGPIIDNKDFYIQYLLKQGFIEFVNDENDNITFKSIQKCDLNLFSKQEILVMNKVIKKLKDKTSNELTNWSHNFKGWINTKPGKIISYSYAKDFDLIKGW